MELIQECVLHVDVGEALTVGSGPAGTRMIIPVSGGWVRGSRLNGVVDGPGGDWALLGDDGFARLDVRSQFRTDDGAIVYISYSGLLELNEATMSGQRPAEWCEFELRVARCQASIEAVV
jgi:hypothetical protein